MRQHHMWSACLSLAGVTLMGCAHVSTPAPHAAEDVSVRREPVCAEAVMLYTSANEVRAAFQPLGVVTYTDQSRLDNEAALMNLVRRKAAQMGATGVILPSPQSDVEQLHRVFAMVAGSATEPGNRSVAIYVPEDSARVRVTCSED